MDQKPVSLEELEPLLSDLTYPTDLEQILVFAKERHLEDSAIVILGMLPDVVYDSYDDLVKALEELHNPDSLPDASSADPSLGSTALHDGYEDAPTVEGDDDDTTDTTYGQDEPEDPQGGSMP